MENESLLAVEPTADEPKAGSFLHEMEFTEK